MISLLSPFWQFVFNYAAFGGIPPTSHIDTATKRASAINLYLPWRDAIPFPDATVAAGDRKSVANAYAG